MNEDEIHELKARECLVGAEAAFANGCYNNAANRAYYACFHAAVVALIRADIRRDKWEHQDVRRLFAGQLIGRWHLYSGGLRSTLQDIATLRDAADYGLDLVSQTRMERVLRRAIYFMREVLGDGR